MLSEELRNLSRNFSDLADRGFVVQMSGEQAEHYAAVLKGLAEQAEALEAAQIPEPLQMNDGNLPANVLRIARRLDRQGVTAGYPPAGGAA